MSSRPKAGVLPGRIRVGTASWSDPGFVADWYPAKLPASERLPWYAEHFDLVEVNSTFYAIPSEKVVARWAEQTPADFLFDVKLHQFLSRHSTASKWLPPELRPTNVAVSDKVPLTPARERAVAKQFLEAIQPLAESKKLGALLLQLTPGFSPRQHHLEELDALLDLLRDYRVAVELRNRNWYDDTHRDKTVSFFQLRHVSLASVDAPKSEHLTVTPNVDAVTDRRLVYLRAHGRNVKGYVQGRSVAERFDHDYTDTELHEIAERVEDLLPLASEVHVIFNNNNSSYAPSAAMRFRGIVGA